MDSCLLWTVIVFVLHSKSESGKGLCFDLDQDWEEFRYNKLITQIFNISGSIRASKETVDHLQPCPQGVCVTKNQCGADGFMVTNDEHLFDLKMSSNTPSEMDTMCRGPEQICCQHREIDFEAETDSIAHIPMGCGYQLPMDEIQNRISGGDITRYGEFPWMIAILQHQKDTVDDYQYVAGASLIHRSVAMTVAHAINKKSALQLTIRAGEWDTQSDDSALHPYQDRNVSRIILHENYNRYSMANSVALLFLSTPFDLDRNVNTVCLPPPNVLPDEGTRCIATGWGRDKFGRGGRYQTILRQIELPIISHAKCQQRLQLTRLGRHFRLHRSFVCAGGEVGKDTCRGDGGSPLVCQIPNGPFGRYFQAGIVAGGIGCGGIVPGLYVNVAQFTNWILQQMYYGHIHIDTRDSLSFDDFYDDYGR